MSSEKIAEILNVDEIKFMHGPKGIAFYVRVGTTWHGKTFDHYDLGTGKHRQETLVRSMIEIAHGFNKSLGHTDDLRKTISGATRAAVAADWMADLRRRDGWNRGPLGTPYDSPQRQVQRADPSPPLPAAATPAGPAVSEPMSSRFHAIMAELDDL